MLDLAEVSLITLVFFTAIILFAGLVHGTLGLGFPLMATPLLALFVDVRSAILITLLPTVVVNVASILRGGKWRDSIGRYWPLGGVRADRQRGRHVVYRCQRSRAVQAPAGCTHLSVSGQ